tara:strand:+ start:6028 stop:6261 length:234 start_codon:yes stop_codon:yes gene_type:complete
MPEEAPIMPTDWWSNVLRAMESMALEDLIKIEETVDKDDSWDVLSLLMMAADNHHFIQHAYDQRLRGGLHVEFIKSD